MKIAALLLPLALSFVSVNAQTLDLTVDLPADSLKVFVKSIDPAAGRPTEIAVTGRQAKGSINADPNGLYYLYATNGTNRYALPIYIPTADTSASLALDIRKNLISTSLSDNDNKALSSFSAAQVAKSMNLGNNLNELTDARIAEIIKAYISDADSIIALAPLSQPVAEYMKLWAYMSAADAYKMSLNLGRRNNRQLSFGPFEVLPDAASTLDNKFALAFPSSTQLIISSLPKGTLEEQLATLDKLYKTPELKAKAQAMLLNSFIDTFDYANNFAEGENRLKAVISQYSLPENYLAAFRGRLATIPGTPFPSVALVDREGNPVDFSKFRGKYVYIDLWASWCGPCCKEVPHLQELEKEFTDSPDVVFVSISIDSTKEPWLKKMTQLNMHGNQLWNSDGLLTRQLNVRGIPHFLIYDREGRLHTYNAPRPSAEGIRSLLKSLK